MRTAQEVVDQAVNTGTVLLGGEMEFSTLLTCREAYDKLFKIAEAIGGSVSKLYGPSWTTLEVICPYEPGYWILDWFSEENKTVQVVRRYEESSAGFPGSTLEEVCNQMLPAKGGK